MTHELARYFPGEVADAIISESELLELRVRAGHRVRLVAMDRVRSCGERMLPADVRQIAMKMMEYSFYAREAELSRGFFTMKNGCRVGVSGEYSMDSDGGSRLRTIASLCVRIAREVRGCGAPVAEEMTAGGLKNILVLSKPGMGKTTILRDAARLLSESGYTVGIADERHELAACRDGISTLDVGPNTDVADGLPKRLGMEYLIRSMAPQVLVTDEIGDEGDVRAIREASRRGVALIASAHGADMEDVKRGALGEVFAEGLFSSVVLLKDRPGRIGEIIRR